jgi:DNA polymerase IIIc chi subunit
VQADLYLIPGSTFAELVQFACKLCEKVFKSGHTIKLLCEDEAQTLLLDDSLWSFSATSFIPHQISQNPTSDFPIAICASNAEQHSDKSNHGPGDDQSESIKDADVVMYLSPQLALRESLSKNARQLLLVPNTPEETSAAREAFKKLKASGFQIETHDLRPTHPR